MRARWILVCAAASAALPFGPRPARAAYPGVDGRIVYATGQGFSNELRTVNPDGSDDAPFLTFKPPGTSFNFPCVSPSGHRVAFVYYATPTGAGQNNPLFLGIGPASGTSFGTVGGVKAFGKPTWSPDGKKIAYLGEGGIYVADASTGVAKLLLAQKSSVTYDQPAWSPDGARIALQVSEHVGPYGLERDVGVVPATGGAVVNLTRPALVADYPGRDAGGMNWSPDGKKIVFHRGTESRPQPKANGEAGPLPSTVMMLDVATREISEVIHETADVSTTYYDPVFSPDGTQILALQGATLVVMDASGANVHFVNAGTAQDPVYLTSGSADWQRVPAGDTITMTLDPSSRDRFGAVTFPVAASGFATSRGSVELLDASDTPLPSESVSVRPNIRVDPQTTANPRILVCRADGRRLWPNRNPDQTIDYLAVPTVSTDGQGHADFRVLAGTQAGTELLIETYETADEKADAGKFLKIVGDVAGAVNPVSLLADLTLQLDLASTRCLPSPTGTDAQKQDTLLEWLLALRYLAANGDNVVGRSLLAVEFAPVHAGTHAAIVFYPGGSSPNPLLDYIAKTGTPGDPTTWYVLDSDELVGAAVDNHKPRFALDRQEGKLRNLKQWEDDVGAPAQKGRLAPYPDEDLTYFGWPYPPPAGVPAAENDRAFFDRCVALPGLSVRVHSPVDVLFTDAQSNSLGVDAAGKLHFDLPGVVVVKKGGNPTGYVLPPGGYAATLTGTGAGAATIEFRQPGASGATSTIFTLKSKKGATGTVAVDATTGAAQQATFAGAPIAANTGLALAVSGVPKKLKSGRRAKFVVVVRDPWKKPVVGAEVRAQLAGYPIDVATDKKGRATISAVVPHLQSATNGSVAVSAAGFVDATKTVPLN